MANPPITIGPFTNVPAPGSPIKSDWPQSITQAVVDRWNQHVTSFEFPAVGGNWNAPNDGVTEWIGVNATVPAWATKAFVLTTISLVQATTLDNTFALKMFIGSNSELFAVTPYRVIPKIANQIFQLNWTSEHTVSAGSKRFSVMVLRDAGTGSLFIVPQSSARCLVHYR